MSKSSKPETHDAFGFDLPDPQWFGCVRRALSDGPASDAPAASEVERSPEQPGQHIGPYELLSLIGTGGMGTVWRARRADKRPDRVVAIKLIRSGIDSRTALQRFRLEEQVLARLEHHNIARLYDGGKTAQDRPYFVMEFVEGIPIDEYADRHALTVDQRLKLFEPVCDAVQFAHGSLVLHRDIKPSNILVTADGVPKLLDFGIAKIVDDDAEDSVSNITITEARVLTPRYASPEQVRGERLTTATDVYSLGVVLYELLTRCSPYCLDTGTRHELERAVLDQEVRQPSVAVADGRGARHAEWKRIQAKLRGDLDTIVVTALQKDPARRYASPELMAGDLNRQLRGLPISAAADSMTYRFSRFVGRNKGLVAGVFTAALALVAATVVAATFAVRESQARAEAEHRTNVAESVNSFLNDDLLAAVDPHNTDDPDLTMRDVLDRAALGVEGRFGSEPLVEASIRQTIGKTYRSLGLATEGVAHLRRAVDIYETQLGLDHADTRNALRELCGAMLDENKGNSDVALAQDLLERDIRADGLESHTAMSTIGLLAMLGHPYEDLTSIETFEMMLAWQRENLGDLNPETLSTMRILANQYLFENRIDEAEPLVNKLWRKSLEAFGESDPRTLKAMSHVAMLCTKRGEHQEALDVLRESIRIHRETMPANFFGTGIMLGHLAQTYIKLERNDEAESTLLESHKILSASLGPDAGWTTGVARLLADLYEKNGDDEKAALWREKQAAGEGQ